MARQKFGIKVIGTLDDINFQRTGGKDIVKLKGGVEKARIMTDEKFVRTRENMSEFGRAGNEAKGLTDALAPLIAQAYDRYYFSRLLAKMKQNLNTDVVNARGERTIQYLGLGTLVNFAFNEKAKLASILRAPYATTSPGAGQISVDFPQGINPKWDIKAPANSTRFQIGLVIAGKVTGEDRYERSIIMGPISNLDTVIPAGSFTLTTPALPNGSYEVLVGAMGIFFGQEVNGGDYAFHNKAFNSLDIVAIYEP